MYGRFRQLYLRRRDRELGQNGRESKPAFAPLIHFNLANSWPRGPRPGNSITKRERANRAIVAAKEKEFSGTGEGRGGEGRGRGWNCDRDYPVRSIKARSLIAFCRFECAAMPEIRLNRSLNCRLFGRRRVIRRTTRILRASGCPRS